MHKEQRARSTKRARTATACPGASYLMASSERGPSFRCSLSLTRRRRSPGIRHPIVASATSAWLLFAPYALHYGLAEGGQRALLAELVPASLRGRAFGTALAVEGAAILPANVAFGWAYDRFGAPASFSVAAVLALFAALMLAALVDVDVDKRQPTA